MCKHSRMLRFVSPAVQAQSELVEIAVYFVGRSEQQRNREAQCAQFFEQCDGAHCVYFEIVEWRFEACCDRCLSCKVEHGARGTNAAAKRSGIPYVGEFELEQGPVLLTKPFEISFDAIAGKVVIDEDGLPGRKEARRQI